MQSLLFLNNSTLHGLKHSVYVLIKILKFCTGSSAKSYQCKFSVSEVFKNKSIWKMEEVGAAIKEIIHYKTIRGKFSSVHPDLAAEGITRVEVGEEGLHFISDQQPGELPFDRKCFNKQSLTFDFTDSGNQESASRNGRR